MAEPEPEARGCACACGPAAGPARVVAVAELTRRPPSAAKPRDLFLTPLSLPLQLTSARIAMTDVEAPAQDFEVVNAPGEEAAFATADEVDAPEIKLFGKWTLDDVICKDQSVAVREGGEEGGGGWR